MSYTNNQFLLFTPKGNITSQMSPEVKVELAAKHRGRKTLKKINSEAHRSHSTTTY